MIEVLIEVGEGPARTRMAIRAESVRRAVEAARAQYPDARVVYPIDPERFFVRGPAIPAGLVGIEMLGKAAG